MWKKISAFKALEKKSDDKRPHRSPSRILSDNIKIDQKEIDRKIVVWIHLAQDRDQWQALVKI